MNQDFLPTSNKFIADIIEIVRSARNKAYSAVNYAQVEANWLIGKRIIEQEQEGKRRAEYGAEVLKKLSKSLTAEFGKGFTVSALYYCRRFHLTFPTIFDTVCQILPWSHYKRLLRVDNEEARDWYLKEATEQMWSYRTLDRNINTQYYHRLLMANNQDAASAELENRAQESETNKLEFIKNPMITEFFRTYTKQRLYGK